MMGDSEIFCEVQEDGSSVTTPTTITATSSKDEQVLEMVAGVKGSGAKTRGVYSSLFRYNHTDKKLPFLANFIKN